MLQSFIGTFDAAGLRTLRFEFEGSKSPLTRVPGSLPFWAVLDSRELLPIEQALVLGERQTALQLLSETAISLGPVEA